MLRKLVGLWTVGTPTRITLTPQYSASGWMRQCQWQTRRFVTATCFLCLRLVCVCGRRWATRNWTMDQQIRFHTAFFPGCLWGAGGNQEQSRCGSQRKSLYLIINKRHKYTVENWQGKHCTCWGQLFCQRVDSCFLCCFTKLAEANCGGSETNLWNKWETSPHSTQELSCKR